MSMFRKFILALFLLFVASFIANRYNVDQNSQFGTVNSRHANRITLKLTVGSFYIPKHNKNANKTTLKLTVGSFYIPKDNKNRPQGEDAHFMCEARNVIGVADGVGGWNLHGIDAGEYARELLSNSKIALLDQTKGSVQPVEVMQSAYEKTHSKGSATACIIALNDNNVLRYANLGDSGFILFRGDTIVYQSPVQHHAFNMPYQLGTGSMDTPDDSAHEEEIDVEDGDIIVAGTDGLFDNVYPDDIEKILKLNKNTNPKKLASNLAKIALINAKDESYYSPLAKAVEMMGSKHQGGKYDDITVVVAKIQRDMST